jgi:hypothetical protein
MEAVKPVFEKLTREHLLNTYMASPIIVMRPTDVPNQSLRVGVGWRLRFMTQSLVIIRGRLGGGCIRRVRVRCG